MDTVITADDEAFVAAFHQGQIANQQFHHRDHLRLAWVQIQRHGLADATNVLTHAIRGFAQHHGRADRYNDTMTRFWIRAVHLGIRRHPSLGFEALLNVEPHLLDKSLPSRHWSNELLSSVDAKQAWVEPDLRPMPSW